MEKSALNAMRLMQAGNLLKPDVVPVFLPIESGFMSEFGGVPQLEYHNDPVKMLECQAKVSERFGGLSPLYTDFGVVTEAAAFCDIYWPEDDSPWAHPAVKSAEEIDGLAVPDMKKDGLFPRVVEYFGAMNERAVKMGVESIIRNPKGPVGFGSVRGPVVLASMIRGLDDFFAEIILNPEQTHKLLNIATETLLAYLELQKSIVGNLPAIFMCDDVSGLLSPRHWEEFFLPYAKRIFDAHKSSLTIYHCDAPLAKSVPMVPQTGAKAFHLGFMHDLAEVKASIGDKIAIFGNVHPVATLMRQTPADVREAARLCIEKAAPGGGFALSSGGVVDRGTPPENIDALIAAADEFGKY